MVRKKPDTALPLPLPLQFLAAWIGCWVARHQEETIGHIDDLRRVRAGIATGLPGWNLRDEYV